MEICLFEPDIAGNVGTIIRTASFFDVKKVHIIMPTGFIFDTKTFNRTKMDYGENVEILKYENFSHFMSTTQQRIVLLTTKTSTSHCQFSYLPNDIIMAGSESRGVTDEIRAAIKNQVTIAKKGIGRSLNVAISVSIVLSEAYRQNDLYIN